jgi:general secretion pathway protein D
MNHFMTKLARSIAVALVLLIVSQSQMSYAAPLQQPLQPGPGKKLVQGVFGPVEVDVSDPRPGIAFGPPLQPAAPQPAATPPAPVQAAPTATPAPVNSQDPIVPVQLHFNNAEIHGVIDVIAGILAINYAIDPSVRGTVNLNSSGDIHRSDLLPILETILKMNGATMIKSGNFYQIVPANTAVRNAIEVQSAVPAVAPDDQIIVQIIAMKFVAADEMAKLLTPFLSESGNIVAQGGLLLITDRRSNLRKLLEIVDSFDSRAFQGERVRMLAVKNSKVKDIADDLKTVFTGYALSTNTAIRFLPIERLNSVLVVSPNPTVFPEVERWLQQLDQPVQTTGLRNYVYHVQNAKAADIQRVLAELYGAALNQPANTPAAGRPIQGNAPAPAPAPSVEIGPGTLPSVEVPPSGARLSSELRVIADTINNYLLIQATPQDYQTIERTIEDLDVLPRQVLIDAQVYEVTLDHSLQLGLSAVLQNRGTLANPQTTGSFSSSTGLSVTTFAFVGRSRELVAFLNAQENRSRVRTLSAPSILVSNNAQASVQVGAEVPIPTSTAASAAIQNSSTVFAQTIQFRDTGVILNVTPQINAGGNVTLNIAQEISQAQANTTSTIAAPVIGKSSVKSTIVVKDGETIPITGFIRESEELTRSRIPLLGDIPYVGVLFGDTNRSKSRTELIVLITPHVVTTPDERSAAAEELKAKLKETQRLIN